jgi:hypothetical protein
LVATGGDGFRKGFHTVPTDINDSAESWCHRLLADRVAEELQDYYQRARDALDVRRRDLRKEAEDGSGNLDTPAFRYWIETGQNPDDPAEYIIRRRLALLQGWPAQMGLLVTLRRDHQIVEFILRAVAAEEFDQLVEALHVLGRMSAPQHLFVGEIPLAQIIAEGGAHPILCKEGVELTGEQWAILANGPRDLAALVDEDVIAWFQAGKDLDPDIRQVIVDDGR